MTDAQLGTIASYGAKQGTLREYETVMIVRPEANKPVILDLVKRLQGIVEGAGGRLLKIDSWGTRILAYPIAHCRKGVYLYWRYLGGSDTVQEFERNLRILDLVIRHHTVLVGRNIEPEARPGEVTEDLLDAVSDPGPDPEELRRKAEAEARARAEAEAKAAAEARAAEAQAAEAKAAAEAGEES